MLCKGAKFVHFFDFLERLRVTYVINNKMGIQIIFKIAKNAHGACFLGGWKGGGDSDIKNIPESVFYQLVY